MKKTTAFLICAMSVLATSPAFADRCIYQADAAAKALMQLNQERVVSTDVSNIQNVRDEVNTDFMVYDVVGLAKSGRQTTLTYRVSVDHLNSCRIRAIEILGGG